METFDGDYKVIFSNTVNLYDDKLIFEKIAGFKFVFVFETDKEHKGTGLKIDGDPKTNSATITLINFKNVLGSATTKRIKIIETEKGESIYFSIFAKSLNPETPFLQVSTTFYIR